MIRLYILYLVFDNGLLDCFACIPFLNPAPGVSPERALLYSIGVANARTTERVLLQTPRDEMVSVVPTETRG